MKVFLIGFMGSGKTTIGKKLSKLLDYNFIDIDKLIEFKYKKSIIEIFEAEGEKYFRDLETKELNILNNYNNIVVSCGGGLPCFNNNMDYINKNGISFYISLSEKSLYFRLINSKKERPLLKNINKNDLPHYIANTLEKREVFYLKANYIIKGENININDIADLVINY